MTISADFPFEKNFAAALDARIAYVDVGTGAPVVFLHGNPTSSYLWRNVIPHVLGLARCIAPDLVGMGASSKPESAYRYADHARYLDAFFDALDLRDATLVMHDWGSALGLDWAMRNPSRVRAVALTEAILSPVPSWDHLPPEGRALFQALRTPGVGERMILDENAFIEQLLPRSILRGLTPAELAHYRAPFLERAARLPTLAWPRELPIAGEPPEIIALVERYRAWLASSPIPKLLLTVTPGVLVQAPLVAWCRAHLSHLTVVDLGAGLHYPQEEHPHELGDALAAWLRNIG